MGTREDQTYAGILRRAAEVLGGMDELCKRIGATRAECDEWIQGNSMPRREVFMKLVDVLVEHLTGKPPVQ